MASNRDSGFTIDGMDQWLEWLNGLEGQYIEDFKSKVLRSFGFAVLEQVDNFTPRQTGRLQNSVQFGDRENVFQVVVGRSSYVAVGTTVEYAEYVEEGFEISAPRYVPGFWQGGKFHYVPGEIAKAQGIGGMVIKAQVIEGAHMFKKGLDAAEADFATIVEFEFRRLYGNLFRG
jgi:hypothetical protein